MQICPYCEVEGSEWELQCHNCQANIPFCIASGAVPLALHAWHASCFGDKFNDRTQRHCCICCGATNARTPSHSASPQVVCQQALQIACMLGWRHVEEPALSVAVCAAEAPWLQILSLPQVNQHCKSRSALPDMPCTGAAAPLPGALCTSRTALCGDFTSSTVFQMRLVCECFLRGCRQAHGAEGLGSVSQLPAASTQLFPGNLRCSGTTLSSMWGQHRFTGHGLRGRCACSAGCHHRRAD